MIYVLPGPLSPAPVSMNSSDTSIFTLKSQLWSIYNDYATQYVEC